MSGTSTTSDNNKDKIRNGSCLCGAIRFTIKGDPFHYTVCHCANCKKSSGGPFMMNIWFKEETFTLLSGKDALKAYKDPVTETGKPLTRHFCSNCGSNVYFRMSPDLPRSDVYIIQGPMIEGNEAWGPRKHSFAAKQTEWVKIEMTPKGKSKL